MNNEYYYISSGDQTKMYTLRTRYNELVGEELVERDYYIRNLSTDADTAVQKAHALGYTSVKHPSFDLQEIRRNQENARNEARASYEEEKRQRQEEKDQYAIDLINSGKVPFGKYQGQEIKEMERSYREWVVYKATELDAGVVIKAFAAYIKANFKQVSTKDSVHIGSVKTRMRGIKLTLVRSLSFEGYYGRTYVEIFHTKSGNVVVYKGGRPTELQIDESAKFDFTVKAHEEYRGVKQTIIVRMKELE